MSFASTVAAFCRTEAPAFVDKTIRRTVIEIGNRVVERSPVGDASYWSSPAPAGYVGGRFRGNWQYGFAGAPIGDLDRVDPSGGNAIQDIVTGTMSANARGVHYLVNNLPYAERIENGWSDKAPHGVVSLVELEFQSIFNAALRS